MGRCKAFSLVHKDHFYVCQGQDSRHDGYSEDQLLPLQRYDFTLAQWRGVSPVCVDHEPEEKKFTREFTVDGGVCCVVLGNCAYTFGGQWKYGYAVHELNLESIVWRRLEPKNREDGPIHKIRAGMVACRHEALCVFGGFGLDTDFTNELHLYHIVAGRSILHENK